MAILSLTARIVFVLAQAALEDTTYEAYSYDSLMSPRWVESYLSDSVLFYLSQGVFFAVYYMMCSLENVPKIDTYV